MVYLDEIIKFINSTLLGVLTAYPTALYTGIVVPVYVQNKSGVVSYPGIFNNFESIVSGVYFEHTAPFVVYHKLTVTNFNLQSQGKTYGQEGLRIVNCITNASMVIMGSRAKLNGSAGQLALQVADSLPGNIIAPEFQALDIQYLNVVETGIDYDQKALFNKDFTGVKNFIGPELFMLGIRYNIEGSYLKGCASKCIC